MAFDGLDADIPLFVELNKLRTAESLGSVLWTKVSRLHVVLRCVVLFCDVLCCVTAEWLVIAIATLATRVSQTAVTSPIATTQWDSWFDVLLTAEHPDNALDALLVRSRC